MNSQLATGVETERLCMLHKIRYKFIISPLPFSSPKPNQSNMHMMCAFDQQKDPLLKLLRPARANTSSSVQ